MSDGTKELRATEEAIARYRGSEHEEFLDNYQEGLAEGFEWGADWAEPLELTNLRDALTSRYRAKRFADLPSFDAESFLEAIDPDDAVINLAQHLQDFQFKLGCPGFFQGYADGGLEFLRQAEARFADGPALEPSESATEATAATGV